MKRTALASALLCCLGAAPAPSWPADAMLAAANPAQSETIVLRVRLNTLDKGDLFVERTPDGDFLIKVEDLKAMGLKDPPGRLVVVDGEPFISLKSMRGVTFDFQEKALALNITVEPYLLPGQALRMEGQRTGPRGAVPDSNSAFFNYALTTSTGDGTTTETRFAGELGWRLGDYLLLSNGNTIRTTDGGRKFVRLMSSVTRDDREELRRTIVGDFFTPSRDFSTGVNLGGISVAKLYGLNPYFIQFPMQSVGGTVALPSDLEVYLDGQRIRTERLQPGQFQLNDILAYGGARNVQLLLRDSFGRVQQLSYSFYFSDQPLRQGLHEYSYNAGAIRRDYGTESNHYGPVAATMFHRYGFSDVLTLGLRAEASKELFNAGPLTTVVLGNAGVVSTAIAASSIAGRHGASALASYGYQTKNWSIGASLRRDWRDYASLGDPPTMTNRKLEGNVSASYHVAEGGTISLSHSFLSTRDGIAAATATPARPFSVLTLDGRHVTALSYNMPLVSGRATLSATLSHIKDITSPRGRNEVLIGVIFFLDKDYSVATNYRRDNTSNTESVQLTKNQPIGEGLGFIVSADRASDPSGQNLRFNSSAQYNAPAAIFRADVGRVQDQQGRNLNDYRASVAGGVGYVDGNVGFGRPIVDSFGIVKVGELAGVEVSVNGQPMGTTNSQGKAFVPTLTPYYDNEVSVADASVPIDYSIATRKKTISPSSRSGAVVEFPVTKLQAFTGHLKYQQAGGIKPLEFQEISIEVAGKKQSFETGRGGEFYIENIKPGTYAAKVEVEGKPCLFDLIIPASNETFVELGELQCRPAP
jgi:outer membrane usher protein